MNTKGKKPWGPSRLGRSLFCAALCLAQALPAFSSPDEPVGSGRSSAGELSRLIEISIRLEQLNGTLRSELEGSRRSSADLRSTLEQSKLELAELRSELEALRSSSTELALSAESSRRESDGLREALRTAEYSLRNLEASFEAYRSAADREILRLDASRRRWRTAFFAAAAAAASSWAAYALSAR